MPSAAKARMASRTVWVAQPSRARIAEGLSPSALASEDLAAPQGEGRGRAEAGPEGLGLLGGQRADEEGWFHTPSTTAASHGISCESALAVG